MGLDSLIYSFVTRGTVVLAEYATFPGNCGIIAVQCLEKLPTYNTKCTYICDRYTFNFLVEDGFTFLVVADEEFGRQVPFAFLDRVKEDFQRRYGGDGGGKAQTANAQSLNREFGPKLKEHMTFCVEHPEEVGRVSQIQSQVSEVKSIMMDNINKVLDRGEQIEVLVDKTDALRDRADDFQQGGHRLRKHHWGRLLRIAIPVAMFIIFFILAIIFIAIFRKK